MVYSTDTVGNRMTWQLMMDMLYHVGICFGTDKTYHTSLTSPMAWITDMQHSRFRYPSLSLHVL